MPSEYHGIIIQQSLRDQYVLQKMRILGKKVSVHWTLLRVGVDDKRIDEVVNAVKENLLTENNVPYYAHFYRGQQLVVVFPDRLFYMKTDKETWNPAVSYGISKGIPREQMDFKPCRVEEETF